MSKLSEKQVLCCSHQAGPRFDLLHVLCGCLLMASSGCADREQALPSAGGDIPALTAASATGDRDRAPPTEDGAFQRWQACVARLSGVLRTPDERHDAWLEAAQRLERALESHPGHLGMQRDLLDAYAALLSYERDSPLGGQLCLAAAQRLEHFADSVQPLGADDVRRVAALRTWLFFVMRLYPLAQLETVAMPPGDDRAAMLSALAALRQDKFLELEPMTFDGLQVRAFRAVGAAPHDELLWPQTHWLVLSPGRPAPHRVVAYTLSCRGPADARRYYLCVHALNESKIVAMYGPQAPPLSEVCEQVRALVHAALPRGQVTAGTSAALAPGATP